MHISYHNEFSHRLGREMEYKVYGHQGKPVLMFPTSNGRFYQYEDSGMIEALSRFINEGRIQVWTVDGIDRETFFSESWDKLQRINRHEQYFAYIKDELVPSVLNASKHNNGGTDQKLLLTGCSMGAYHASNFYFHYPDLADTVIALSGVYSTKHFFGDYRPTEIYLHSPIDYLKNNHEGYYLDHFRRARLIFCCGQGAWEEEMLDETHQLQEIFVQKNIPAWFDYWGKDAAHDWFWWHRQAEFFFSQVL